jgi:hypothetical protein
MPISDNARSAAAIHRKLRALANVFLDPAATEHEKDNAKRLKERLEGHLGQDAAPERPLTQRGVRCQGQREQHLCVLVEKITTEDRQRGNTRGACEVASGAHQAS